MARSGAIRGRKVGRNWGYCFLCGRAGAVVWHHHSYVPEEVIPICPGCHFEIHAGSALAEWGPDLTRGEFERALVSAKQPGTSVCLAGRHALPPGTIAGPAGGCPECERLRASIPSVMPRLAALGT